MEPIFTLPWNEFYIAEKLAKRFSKANGYSVLVPTSRQEKDIDLVLLQRKKRKAITIQVKFSRTYIPAVPKRETTKRYNYYSWFNVFEVSPEADFYVLSSHYVDPPAAGTLSQKKTTGSKTALCCSRTKR